MKSITINGTKVKIWSRSLDAFWMGTGHEHVKITFLIRTRNFTDA